MHLPPVVGLDSYARLHGQRVLPFQRDAYRAGSALFCCTAFSRHFSCEMAAYPPTLEALTLLDSIAKLSDGLKNGEQGAREGLLGACSKLISELSHPTETMLMLLWAQPSHHTILRMAVEIRLFQAMSGIGAEGQRTADIAAKCAHQADPILVGNDMQASIPGDNV